jgi:hypothetical protein
VKTAASRQLGGTYNERLWPKRGTTDWRAVLTKQVMDQHRDVGKSL